MIKTPLHTFILYPKKIKYSIKRNFDYSVPDLHHIWFFSKIGHFIAITANSKIEFSRIEICLF